MTRTTFNRLREVKDSLPHGSMDKIAEELGVSADEVRAYFNGTGSADAGYHIEPGPDGGSPARSMGGQKQPLRRRDDILTSLWGILTSRAYSFRFGRSNALFVFAS